MSSLQEQFGPIDIYLFDQLLRGRIQPGMRVLDAGCGSGRNLVYLLRERYEVFGVDSDARAIAEVRRLAAALAPDFVGLWQVNIEVPMGVTQGDLPLVVSVDGQSSNSANVSVTP